MAHVQSSRTCQEAATLMFSNFSWEGVDLSLHSKGCDVLSVQGKCSSGH